MKLPPFASIPLKSNHACKVLKVYFERRSPSPNSHVTSMDILNSKVVSAVVVGAKKVAFQSPVVLVLPHLKVQ